MSNRLKATILVLLTVGFLVAQQPIQLQTVNGGGAVALGHGTAATALRVELPTDGTGQVGLAAGANTIGAVTQASGPWTQNMTQVAGTNLGTPTTYGTAPSGNAIGVNAFVTNSLSFSFAPSSSSGAAVTPIHAVGSTSTFNTAKGSAGNLYGLDVFNPNTTPCYLVFYNSASPTIGTTTPIYAIGVQAGTNVSIPAGAVALANFSTGITYAGTTTDGGSSVCTTGMSTNVFIQ